MPDAAVARADRELQMLEALVDCAHGLAMAFGEAAQAERGHTAALQLFDAFHRSFLAVRMGIRLSLTLRAAPKAVAAAASERDRPEREAIELERAEFERPESEHEETDRSEAERERDRDYEPVSLPRFLATLGVVAAEAGRAGERLPADIGARTLPALRDLLARAKADAAAPVSRSAAPSRVPVDVLIRPPPAAPKAALLGSASASLMRPVGLSPLPRPPPHAPGRR